MTLRAGKLRHQVVIQAQDTTQDSYGDAVRSWEDVATVWAEVRPLSGRELWAAQQTQATTTHQVVLRYLDGVTSSCRVKYGTRLLGIDAVLNPDERNERLVLLCTEGASDDGG